jgi:hypothetical protein
MRNAYALFGFAFATLVALPSLATERSFTYTYETPVAAPGHSELEPWVTYRTGRDEHFNRYDLRIEYEGGVLPGLQTALYMNFAATSEDQFDELTGERYRTQSFNFTGVSNEWKYQLSDPVADPVGTALYLEGTFAPQRTELEAKFLLDKHIGPFITAMNLVGEYEWEYPSKDETTRYAEFEVDLAAGVEVTKALVVGAEVNAPIHVPEDGPTSSVLNVGPALGARFDRWWLATTFLMQVAALKNPTSGTLNLERYERFQVRTVWGFHL